MTEAVERALRQIRRAERCSICARPTGRTIGPGEERQACTFCQARSIANRRADRYEEEYDERYEEPEPEEEPSRPGQCSHCGSQAFTTDVTVRIAIVTDDLDDPPEFDFRAEDSRRIGTQTGPRCLGCGCQPDDWTWTS